MITPWNYEHLAELVEIATDLGIDGLNFQHLMFVSEEINRANQKFFEKTFGYDPKLLDTFPVLSPEAIDTSRVSAELETFKRTAAVPIRFLPNLTFQDILCYYEQLDYQFHNTMCIAPWVRATITPKGNVTPCIGYVIVNVLEQRFTKI